MAQQTINVGTAPNDGTGTPLRTAFQYTNSNFSELYTAVGPSGNNIVVPGTATISGDLTVDTSTLKVDSALNKVGVGVATLTGLQTFNVAGDVGITSDLVLKNSGGTVQGYIFGSSGINYRVIAGQPHVWQEGGSDLMRLNSTGLGVGGSPSRKLDIYGTPITIGGTATGMLVTVANNGTAYNASPTSGLALWNKFNSSGSLFPSAAIQAGKENATDGNYAGFLSLYTVDSGGTPNERMRIDSTGNVISNVTGTAPTLATNSQMVFNLTSNTNLRISVRGSDGVTRTTNLTLA